MSKSQALGKTLCKQYNINSKGGKTYNEMHIKINGSMYKTYCHFCKN